MVWYNKIKNVKFRKGKTMTIKELKSVNSNHIFIRFFDQLIDARSYEGKLIEDMKIRSFEIQHWHNYGDVILIHLKDATVRTEFHYADVITDSRVIPGLEFLYAETIDGCDFKIFEDTSGHRYAVRK
mgnify:CR=1 FL=1